MSERYDTSRLNLPFVFRARLDTAGILLNTIGRIALGRR